MNASAYWMEDGALRCGKPEDFFPFFDDGKKHIVSLVGGGGKSTLLDYLAHCFAARGVRTAVMTTTRMACPARICTSMEDCRACWREGVPAACGEKLDNGKFRAPQDELLAELLAQADAIVIEADGAHMMACKAPDAHEPVILPQTDIVIGVMGVEVLGHEVDEVCHRPHCVRALLCCAGDHALTAGDMAKIFLSPAGSHKDVGDRAFYAVINKCDDETRVEGGLQVLEALARQGHTQAVLTSFADKK